MLVILKALEGIGLLALVPVGLLVFFHFLLVRELLHSRKTYTQKLEMLEKLALAEISRSKLLRSQTERLQQQKDETEEKLGLIRILLEMLRKEERKGSKN